MAKVGSLLIDLAMNTARLQADAQRAGQTMGRMERTFGRSLKGIEQRFGNVTRGIRRFGLAIGVSLGAAGLGRMVSTTVQAADHVQKLSIRIGASTEALSEYQHVAQLSGVENRTLELGWQRMTRRIAEAAQGTGEARGALDELGLSAQTLSNMRPEDQFETIADAMLGVTNEAHKVRLSMKLFDSEGVALLQTMDKGAAGIRDMRKEARELGLSLSQETTDAAAAANDAITRLSAKLRGVFFKALEFVTPFLDRFASKLEEISINSAKYDLTKINTELTKTRQTILELQTSPGVFASLREMFGTETIEEAVDRQRMALGELLIQREEAVKRLVKLQSQQLNAGRSIDITGGTVVEDPLKAERERAEAVAEINRSIFMTEANFAAASVRNWKLAEAEKIRASQERMDATKDALGRLSFLMSSSDRKQFELGKAAAISNAIVNTYEGVTKTLAKFPGPLGVALASAHAAAGLAQVQAIRATQFGSTSATAATGAGGNVSATDGQATSVTQPQENRSDRQLRIIIDTGGQGLAVLSERQLGDIILTAVERGRDNDDARVVSIS